jgi:hypothetical protein
MLDYMLSKVRVMKYSAELSPKCHSISYVAQSQAQLGFIISKTRRN